MFNYQITLYCDECKENWEDEINLSWKGGWQVRECPWCGFKRLLIVGNG